jgi:hypothetical protein
MHAGCVGVDRGVLLPAAHADDLVAGLEARVARLDDLADRAADHHLVERLRLRVALAVVHAAAHVGVEREEMVAHQHLAVGERRQRRLDEAEIGCRRFALRARCEKDLFVGRHVGLLGEINRKRSAC